MSLTRLFSFRSLCNIKKISQVCDRFYSKEVLNLSEPAVQKYLKNLIFEHEDLINKQRRSIEETKRIYKIKPIIDVLEQRIALYDNIMALKELNKKEGDDLEIKKLIKEEAELYLAKLNSVDNELQDILIEPRLTDAGVLVEIVAGAGGQEAMLFARDLFNMYCAYAGNKGWAYDVASLDRSDIGGVRKASLLIEGYGAPQLMSIEAGVHRVQRIPSTEKGGRMHTSTVSVAVLPQPSEVELSIPDRDLQIETKRASGAGGQHVNTTDSAVRIVHIPTGTAVECQEGRSQIKNKEIALQKLRTLLLHKQESEQTSKVNAQRKSQVGSRERNEKIRTYNFPQDRVTEHRSGGGTFHNIKGFMEGADVLEQLQINLLKQQQYQILMEEIAEFTKKLEQEQSSES